MPPALPSPLTSESRSNGLDDARLQVTKPLTEGPPGSLQRRWTSPQYLIQSSGRSDSPSLGRRRRTLTPRHDSPITRPTARSRYSRAGRSASPLAGCATAHLLLDGVVASQPGKRAEVGLDTNQDEP